MQSLEKRFARGLGWGLIDNFSGTGINFLVGILYDFARIVRWRFL